MKKTAVFIDANIWFSAFYHEGVCSELLRLLTQSTYAIIISEQVLEEIIRNIKKKIPDILALAIEYLKEIKPIVVKNPSESGIEQYRNLAEFKDLPILAAAIRYQCRYFITGNIKDFRTKQIKAKTGLEIITPAHFLSLLKWAKSGLI